MATLIQSITAIWVRWSPENLSGLTQENVLGEQFIRWGVPVTGQLTSLGFMGEFPPPGDVSIGETFSLGTLRILNRPVTGSTLTSVVLQLTFQFGGPGGITQKLDLPFTYEAGENPGDPAVLTLDVALPTMAVAGDLQLTLFGLDQGGEVTPSITAPTGADSGGTIMARLDRSPLEHEACVEGFTPVFTPAGCEVAEVCALPDGPIIFDCGIPEPPDPITDCAEIDVSAPTLASAAEAYADSAIAAAVGGLIALAGCRIKLRVAYVWYWVKNCAHAGIYVTLQDCPEPEPDDPDGRPVCCYLLFFRFYYCWYPVYFYYACCPFIWCDDVWMPADDYWCDGVTPPDPETVIGRWPGELIHICHCTSTTSTTTTSTTTTSTTTTSTTTTSTTPGPTTTTTTTTPEPVVCTERAILVCVAAGARSVSLSASLNEVELSSSLNFPATQCKTYLFITDGGIDADDIVSKMLSATPSGMGCCALDVTAIVTSDISTWMFDDGTENELLLTNNASPGSTSTTPAPSDVAHGTVIVVDLHEVEGEWEVCNLRLYDTFDTEEDPNLFTFTN